MPGDMALPCEVHETLRALPKLAGVYQCEKCERVILVVIHCFDMRVLVGALEAAERGARDAR